MGDRAEWFDACRYGIDALSTWRRSDPQEAADHHLVLEQQSSAPRMIRFPSKPAGMVVIGLRLTGATTDLIDLVARCDTGH